MVRPRKETTLESLFNRAEWNNGCLEWQKTLDKDGYSKAYIDGNFNGKPHRKVFYLVNGYYPPVVRHTCDNRKCINPEHLIGGSIQDNNKDMVERKRYYNHRSQEVKDRARELRNKGCKYKEIMEELGLTKFKQVEYLLRKPKKKE